MRPTQALFKIPCLPSLHILKYWHLIWSNLITLKSSACFKGKKRVSSLCLGVHSFFIWWWLLVHVEVSINKLSCFRTNSQYTCLCLLIIFNEKMILNWFFFFFSFFFLKLGVWINKLMLAWGGLRCMLGQDLMREFWLMYIDIMSMPCLVIFVY